MRDDYARPTLTLWARVFEGQFMSIAWAWIIGLTLSTLGIGLAVVLTVWAGRIAGAW